MAKIESLDFLEELLKNQLKVRKHTPPKCGYYLQYIYYFCLGEVKKKLVGGFQVCKFPSIQVCRFSSIQGVREGGPMRGLGTDNVISRPMRGLEKN